MRGGSRSENREAVMKRILMVIAACCFSTAAWGQKAPLLPGKDVAGVGEENGGETGERELGGGSRSFRERAGARVYGEAAVGGVAERWGAYGLSEVAILHFRGDGKIFYGTQRSRPAWDAEVGELTEIRPGAPPVCDKEKIENGKIVFNSDCEPAYARKIASYE